MIPETWNMTSSDAIEISPQEITYENFDTLEGLVAMVNRLLNN